MLKQGKQIHAFLIRRETLATGTLLISVDLTSITSATGKLVGCYKGKCSGSIRSIAKHPQLPLIASCGKIN
jgi:hypothetical protein